VPSNAEEPCLGEAERGVEVLTAGKGACERFGGQIGRGLGAARAPQVLGEHRTLVATVELLEAVAPPARSAASSRLEGFSHITEWFEDIDQL
jgi:hypothetical protein